MEQLNNSSKGGWVYVLDDQLGHCKIGKTRHLTDRIKQLKIQLPYKLAIKALVRVENCDAAEAYLHDKLAEYRVNGEWFEIGSTEASVDFWHYLMNLDSTFAFQNIYTNCDGRIVGLGWASVLEMQATGVSGTLTAMFDLFESFCLDQACHDFGFPFSHNTRQLLTNPDNRWMND